MRQVKDRDIKRDDGDIRRRVRIVYYYDFSAVKTYAIVKNRKQKRTEEDGKKTETYEDKTVKIIGKKTNQRKKEKRHQIC